MKLISPKQSIYLGQEIVARNTWSTWTHLELIPQSWRSLFSMGKRRLSLDVLF